MGEGKGVYLRRMVYPATVTVIVLVVVAQSVVHLVVVLGTGRVGTFVDLDRSNGLPDIVSLVPLGCAALGAATIARESGRSRRAFDLRTAVPTTLAVVLAILTVADAFHDGAHPSSTNGRLVIGLACVAALLLALSLLGSSLRARAVVAAAGLLLAASFLVGGLDRIDRRFDADRGDPIAEYQIVAKEGLELLGWSLVALGLWDEALRRRGRTSTATTQASRARAASRRRAA
jgi:hypothetical protein